MTPRPDSQPDVGELSRLIDAGEVDTVLVAFPDLQGRLLGKRVTGRFFRSHVLDHGIDACNYLLAVDVDMTPLPGYEFANWEKGYGDVLCRPDLATLRLHPVAREDRARARATSSTSTPASRSRSSPRRILQRQVARAPRPATR